MKTPTTITLIAWNYCQNNCPYCVSESNKEEWKLKNKKTVWKPEGDESLNYYELCEKYGFAFHEKMCPEPNNYLDTKDFLDFDAAINWIKRFRPDAHVHISGGEPLLRSDIEEQVLKVSSLFPTIIVTNGQLIHKRTKLLDMNLKWLVSYHPSQVSLEIWLKNANLIKDKPHVVSIVLTKEMENDRWVPPEELKNFNLFLKHDRNAARYIDFEYNQEDLSSIASHGIMLIQPNGCVMACNKTQYGQFHRYKSESNIYTMECNEDKLEELNERAKRCVTNNRCSAYQTALLMYRLK